MKRLRIGVIFGGRSAEHEVSLVSARSVLAAIDPSRYEVVPIGVTKAGKWLTSGEVSRFLESGVSREAGDHAALIADPSVSGLVRIDSGGGDAPRTRALAGKLDVIFPLIHGGYGEDGKLQGLLEMADLPYVGSGVLGSALGMDKDLAKRLFIAAGLPVVPSLLMRAHEWTEAAAHPQLLGAVRERIAAAFGYPCFVKPACQGSSVGVAKAHDWNEARAAIADALTYDEKVLIENAIDAREIEVAVLGNDDPKASIAGEIVTGHEFYDYEAKYHDSGTRLIIPAQIPEALSDRIRAVALDAFRALELSGMARVDYLVDRRTGEPYLNEVNTIPGFTPVSMYPKLWEATGVSYPALVDRLIQLAIERHAAKRRLRTSREIGEGVPAAPTESADA